MGWTNVSYRYQWVAGGSDINGATEFHLHLGLPASRDRQSRSRVSFTDDAEQRRDR